jgi:hypothetical protein
LVYGANLLGAFAVAAFVVVSWVIVWPNRMVPTRGAITILAMGAMILGLLTIYYLWQRARGAGGYTGREVGVGNIGFAAYELLGFSGLGSILFT